jgi:hypothetical protein
MHPVAGTRQTAFYLIDMQCEASLGCAKAARKAE